MIFLSQTLFFRGATLSKHGRLERVVQCRCTVYDDMLVVCFMPGGWCGALDLGPARVHLLRLATPLVRVGHGRNGYRFLQ
jgi:hypothetical protein